jgi:hypothetical protein
MPGCGSQAWVRCSVAWFLVARCFPSYIPASRFHPKLKIQEVLPHTVQDAFLATHIALQHRHIRIPAFNSQADGIVKQQHLMIRESIVKACEGNISKWPLVAPYTFWAN